MTSTTKEAAGPWGGKTSKTVGDYAEVNGIKLYYEIHGKGKPLVLLHGGLGAIEMFGPALPVLSDHHQVIGVDLQGHGRTADIDRPLSLQFMADDVAALIKHIGLSSVDVMGYSLGAGVAVQLAARHPCSSESSSSCRRLLVATHSIRTSSRSKATSTRPRRR